MDENQKEIEKYGEALKKVINKGERELQEDESVEPIAPVKESFLTVLKVSEYIKNRLHNDSNLNQIYVRGEIKNLSKSTSKHICFDIQEKNAFLNCVLFEIKDLDLDFKLENGVDVFVFGSIQTCKEKSTYQLNVDSILTAKKGELILKFEKLKKKLYKEGLFSEEHKKEIPYLYKTLGLITARDSKAHEDVIKILKHRFPVNIKRVLVDMQEKNAPKNIINAIKALNKIKEIGVILIVGDDGSIEHLKCFNDEALTRAIYNSRTPVIVGIGNETDQTIADYVADKRAPTPEVAAKIAVPDKDEVIDRIALKKEIPETSREIEPKKEIPETRREIEPKKDIQKTSHETTATTYVQKDIPLIDRGREIPKKEKKTKTYKLIALVITLIICIIILIFLISLLL